MKNLSIPSPKINPTQDSFLSMFFRQFDSNPEFDTTVLKKQKCWPITTEHYRPFTIRKRNGTLRELVTVDKNLKKIQSNLLIYFSKNYEVSKYAHGFVAKEIENQFPNNKEEYLVGGRLRAKGVITNALSHTNKKVVISLDLKDFFPSITFPRVMGLLKSKSFDYSNKQAAILATLTCLPSSVDTKRGLPQGAPTSPIISNLICKKLDYQLGKIASKYDLTYSRYADDLTFSTNNLKRISANKIISRVTECVKRNGFVINNPKTKIMYNNQRQMVTGIIVNDGLNLPKKEVDAIRATIHNLENKYKSVDDAVKGFGKLKNKNPYDSFVPLGYYTGGYKGRYIRNARKGKKANKPTTNKEFDSIYALHILGRILWYGQVVTTGVSTPYDLSKRKNISPKQYSRINKYEEILASFYRVSMRFNWPVEHIILRLANNLPHLQSLVKMSPQFLLEPIFLNSEETYLKNSISKLKKEKSDYIKFFESAPESLQRVLVVENCSHDNFIFNTIKKCVEKGWEVPSIQQELFKDLNTGDLSDLFHKSYDSTGHSVKKLIIDLVRVVKPRLRYLSSSIQNKIILVHKELLDLMRSEGEDVRIEYGNESTKTKQALQAIRDLRLAVRLHDDDTYNFYNKVVLEAVNRSGTSDLVNIDRDDMECRMVSDINAWRDSLTKVLMSIKQHADTTEKELSPSQHKPYTIKFKDENPINGESRRVEIYRLEVTLPFKEKLEIDTDFNEGIISKWKVGGDFNSAIKRFLAIGDIFVHGNFIDCENCTVNFTEHSYKLEKNIVRKNHGKLFISFQEIKSK
ncbi:reverse transcriptase family protein [Vibrio splendidus]|uniref:reverse transcriptase family protein n=1 Tax=Vibrio splendidus TaxID=29497 RepID=UPI000D3BBF19|nr:reverse transcriptase family protein [Vibrio splendidus]PTO71413.1 hypothetical protein CWN81_14575 [Vibrio splendidus]